MLVACLVATGTETFRLSVVDCGRLLYIAVLNAGRLPSRLRVVDGGRLLYITI